MRYPILTVSDANAYLSNKRGGSPIDLDPLIKARGNGEELNQSFVNELRADLSGLKAAYPSGLRASKVNRPGFSGGSGV